MRKLVFAVFVFSLVLVGCSDTNDQANPPAKGMTSPTDSASPTTGGGATPTVTITTPAQGASVAAGNVTVTVTVTNFSVVNKLGEAAVPGEGHVHFYLDAQPPTTAGQPAITQQGTYHATATTTYTWPDVKAGQHTFAVQLVNNDHTPLSPPVLATAIVTVT